MPLQSRGGLAGRPLAAEERPLAAEERPLAAEERPLAAEERPLAAASAMAVDPAAFDGDKSSTVQEGAETWLLAHGMAR